MRRKRIGRKNFHGSVDITDPGYDKDVFCRINNLPIAEGIYDCVVWYQMEGSNEKEKQYAYSMVGIIGIYRNGEIPPQKKMELIGTIGVDAGLAGFFHNKPDYTDNEWGKFIGQLTCGDVWLTEEGFFSASGYGDGIYPVYASKSRGTIDALEIRFL